MGKFGKYHVDSFESGEPKDFKAPTKLIPNDFFYYGENMQQKYVTSHKNIMSYIGEYCGGSSVLKSIERDEITVVDIAEPPDYTEEQLKALSPREKKRWDAQITSYNNRESAISAKVQEVYHLVWAHCHTSLQTQIKLDAEFMAMGAEQECYNQTNVTKLLAIIKRLCSGPAVVENPQHSVLESLFNVLFIKGDDYDTLEEYTSVFTQRAEVAEQFGWCFASDKLRDLCVAENKAQKKNSPFATVLASWQSADQQGNLDDAVLEAVRQKEIVAGKEALHESMKAQIYLRRSGFRYLGLRKELSNDYTKGNDNYATTMERQRVMIAFYKPMHVPKKESPVTPGNQNLQKGAQPGGKSDKQNDGGTSAQHLSSSDVKECFRCEQKGKCSAHNCTETTKEDGSPVNSEEVIKERCVVKRKASLAAYAKRNNVGGSQHFMGSEVVPTFEEVIADKEPYENWYYEGHAFVQKNIHVDIRNTGHLFN